MHFCQASLCKRKLNLIMNSEAIPGETVSSSLQLGFLKIKTKLTCTNYHEFFFWVGGGGVLTGFFLPLLTLTKGRRLVGYRKLEICQVYDCSHSGAVCECVLPNSRRTTSHCSHEANSQWICQGQRKHGPKTGNK